MKILLIGYGKMGKAIEAIALSRGHTIAGKIDVGDNLNDFQEPIDVAIEFTQPQSVVSNLNVCIEKGIPVVCGTTGWGNDQPAVEHFCKEKNGTLLYSSNFSLGVNIFFILF